MKVKSPRANTGQLEMKYLMDTNCNVFLECMDWVNERLNERFECSTRKHWFSKRRRKSLACEFCCKGNVSCCPIMVSYCMWQADWRLD